MENYETLYKEVCRLCLSFTNDQMVPLIEENNQITCYGKDVESITQISIENVKAPPQMCQKCLTLLNETKQFINKCKTSQAYFVKIKNCSEFCRKKIIVDTLLCNGFHDNTVPIDMPKPKSMNIDEKPKVEFEIPLFEIKERIKNSANNELPPDQLKHKNNTVKTNNKSQNEILNSLKNNSMIKIEHISNKPTTKVTNTKISKISSLVQKDLSKIKPCKSSRPKTDLARFINSDGHFVCDFCQKSFKIKHSMIAHLKRHIGPRHVCEHCSKAFPTKAELQSHLGTNHGIGKHFKCPECDFATGQKCELVRHKSVHTGERPYICESCGRDFRTRFTLRQHALVHSEKSVQCPKCPLKFRSRSTLSNHDNNRHGRRYMYACPTCGRLYTKNKTVREHLVNVHKVPRSQQGKVPLIRVTDAQESEPITPAPMCVIEETRTDCEL